MKVILTQPVAIRRAKFFCIHEKEPDKGNIGDKYGFFLLPSAGTSKGLEDVDTG